MNSSLAKPLGFPSVAWMSASRWMTSSDDIAGIPSIAIGGSQTAAIRMWSRNTSSPIGYSRNEPGLPEGSDGAGEDGPSAVVAGDGRSGVGPTFRFRPTISATPPTIRSATSGPAQLLSTARLLSDGAPEGDPPSRNQRPARRTEAGRTDRSDTDPRRGPRAGGRPARRSIRDDQQQRQRGAGEQESLDGEGLDVGIEPQDRDARAEPGGRARHGGRLEQAP